MNTAELERIVWRPDSLGTVYGVVLNDEDSLEGLGAAMNAAPYKAPPEAPILYIKPANTLAAQGDHIALPAGADTVEVFGTLGVVFDKPARRVHEADAMSYVRGYTIAADLTLPTDSYYRPPIREKCFDGACPIGPAIAPRETVDDPAGLEVVIRVNAMVAQRWKLARLKRAIPKLIVDISAFMSFNAGDVLLVGAVAKAPTARFGDRISVEIAPIGRLENVIGGWVP